MSDFIIVLILEGALLIACGLVLYCVFIINGLKEVKTIQEGKLEGNHQEIDSLQRNLSVTSHSTETLIRTEEAFATYRGKTKQLIEQSKAMKDENARLIGMLQKSKLKIERLEAQNQNLMKNVNANRSNDETIVQEAATFKAVNQATVDALENKAKTLTKKAKHLEERLEQTLVEKEFIESKFEEIAKLEMNASKNDEELQRARKELKMLESHVIFQDPERTPNTVQ